MNKAAKIQPIGLEKPSKATGIPFQPSFGNVSVIGNVLPVPHKYVKAPPTPAKNPEIIIANSKDDYKKYTLEEILPHSFGPEELNDV